MAVRAQLEVLRELGWDLNAPSPHAALEEMITVLSEKHGENLWPIANHAHTLIELSLWEADVVEFDRLTYRGARKRSKITLDLQHVCRSKSTNRDFRGPNNF